MLSDEIAVKLFNVVLYREHGHTNWYTSHRPFSALSFRLSSSAHFHMDGETIEAPIGSVTFVPEDITYRRECMDEELLVFHFCLYNYVDKHIHVFIPQDPEKYRTMFEEARRVWEERKAGYRHRATAIFYDILCELDRDGALQHESRSPFLAEAERCMNASYSDPNLSIADLAHTAGVSEAYFRRAFHRHYGVSPKQYLLTLRMQRAISLINAGEFTQADIARETGFRDVKYFRAAFKAYTGKSIREYRENPDYLDGMQQNYAGKRGNV